MILFALNTAFPSPSLPTIADSIEQPAESPGQCRRFAESDLAKLRVIVIRRCVKESDDGRPASELHVQRSHDPAAIPARGEDKGLGCFRPATSLMLNVGCPEGASAIPAPRFGPVRTKPLQLPGWSPVGGKPPLATSHEMVTDCPGCVRES